MKIRTDVILYINISTSKYQTAILIMQYGNFGCSVYGVSVTITCDV